MNNSFARRARVATIVGAVLVLGLVGCADSPEAAPPEKTGTHLRTGLMNISDQDADPVSGGTLEFGELSPLLSLDPLEAKPSIATGSVELAAVYDVLVRWDPDSGEFSPKLAEELTHDDDFTTWTIRLRPDVAFSDGTPLDAQAVMFNLERAEDNQQAAMHPYVQMVDRFETPDDLTLVLHLREPLADLPYILSGVGGMMVSPAAVEKYGKGVALRAVGAGPFQVARFQPGEELVLERNDGYWGGAAYLDGVRFTFVAGAQATIDRFKAGELQMGVIGDTQKARPFMDGGVPGYLALNYGGGWLANVREESGSPTADPRVRKAIAYAVDTDQLNQRAAAGTGEFERELFPESSRWHSEVEPLPHDPERARELVEEVEKDTGWDRSLTISAVRSMEQQWAQALALQAQLNSVGFEAKVKPLDNINSLVSEVFVTRDYQLVAWALSFWDASPWEVFSTDVRGPADSSLYGYENPELDELIDELAASGSPADSKRIIGEIQQLWNDDQLLINTFTVAYYVFWDQAVHGVEPTSVGTVLLDKAFIAE